MSNSKQVKQVKQAEQVSQFLTFEIGEEQFGINILSIREIIRYDTLTAVPQTPPFIRGVINMRGFVVPVVDLAVKFGGVPSKVTNLTCIVIVEVNQEGEQATIGVICDAVNQVVDLTSDDIVAPPSFGTRARLDYLLGMGKTGQKFALLLDTDKALAIEEIAAMDEAALAALEGAAAEQSAEA